MKLSPKEVREYYQSGRLKIALIGMSNIGKSHFAGRLKAQFDFDTVEVDAVIQSHIGASNMSGHAAWLGQPYSEGYAQRERDAMAIETRASKEAINQCLSRGNAVLDAPGSIIYTDENVQTQLKTKFWRIYLKASSEDEMRLKQLYYNCPKPLIWNGNYNSSLAADPDDAIIVSYSGLLQERAQLYAHMADMTLYAQQLMDKDYDIGKALGLNTKE